MNSYPYLYKASHYRRCKFCGEPINYPEASFDGDLYHFSCLDAMIEEDKEEDIWEEE